MLLCTKRTAVWCMACKVNRKALKEILEGRSFGQHSLENYIYSCKTKARSRQSQGKQLFSCGRKWAHVPLPPSPLPEGWRARLAALLSLPPLPPREHLGCVREQPPLARRSGEREQAPPGTLVMSPAPPVPARGSSSSSRKPRPPMARAGHSAQASLYFSSSFSFGGGGLCSGLARLKSLEPALQRMWLRSGLILWAPEGSIPARGGAAQAACTRVAACLSAGINCFVDSREATPTSCPAVTSWDKIILGSKDLLFLTPLVHLSNCIDFCWRTLNLHHSKLNQKQKERASSPAGSYRNSLVEISLLQASGELWEGGIG